MSRMQPEILLQEYSPSALLTPGISSDEPTDYDVTYDSGMDNNPESETQDINIDVEIGNKDYSSILDKNSEPCRARDGDILRQDKDGRK